MCKCHAATIGLFVNTANARPLVPSFVSYDKMASFRSSTIDLETFRKECIPGFCLIRNIQNVLVLPLPKNG